MDKRSWQAIKSCLVMSCHLSQRGERWGIPNWNQPPVYSDINMEQLEDMDWNREKNCHKSVFIKKVRYKYTH